MNQAGVARKYGISRQAVNKAIKAGRVKKDGDIVNPVDAEREWGGGKNDSVSKLSKFDLNHEKLAAETGIKQVQLKKLEEEVVDVKEVIALTRSSHSSLRNRLERLPDRLFLFLLEKKVDKSIASEAKNQAEKIIGQSMNKILEEIKKYESNQEKETD